MWRSSCWIDATGSSSSHSRLKSRSNRRSRSRWSSRHGRSSRSSMAAYWSGSVAIRWSGTPAAKCSSTWTISPSCSSAYRATASSQTSCAFGSCSIIGPASRKIIQSSPCSTTSGISAGHLRASAAVNAGSNRQIDRHRFSHSLSIRQTVDHGRSFTSSRPKEFNGMTRLARARAADREVRLRGRRVWLSL
jgi:hypothetical protein